MNLFHCREIVYNSSFLHSTIDLLCTAELLLDSELVWIHYIVTSLGGIANPNKTLLALRTESVVHSDDAKATVASASSDSDTQA